MPNNYSFIGTTISSNFQYLIQKRDDFFYDTLGNTVSIGAGNIGPTGPQGPRGFNGTPGIIGPQGPQGPAGSGSSQNLDQVLEIGNTSSNSIFLDDGFGNTTFLHTGDISVNGGEYNYGINTTGFFVQGTTSISYILGPTSNIAGSWQLPSGGGIIALETDINLEKVLANGNTAVNAIILQGGTNQTQMESGIVEIYGPGGALTMNLQNSGDSTVSGVLFGRNGGSFLGTLNYPFMTTMTQSFQWTLPSKSGTFSMLNDLTLNNVLLTSNTSNQNIILENSSLTTTIFPGQYSVNNGINAMSYNMDFIIHSGVGATNSTRIGFATASSSTIAIIPNKSGTIALLSDITGASGSSNLQQVLSTGNTSSNSIQLITGSGSILQLIPNEEIISGYFDPYINLQSSAGSYIRMFSGSGPGAIPLITLGNSSGGIVELYNGGSGFQSFNFGNNSGTLAITNDLKTPNFAQARVQLNVATYSATTTNDYYIDVNTSIATTNAVVLPKVSTLPSGVGPTFVITDLSGAASANNIKILPNGTDTISGGSSYSITNNYGSITIHGSSIDNRWLITSKI